MLDIHSEYDIESKWISQNTFEYINSISNTIIAFITSPIVHFSIYSFNTNLNIITVKTNIIALLYGNGITELITILAIDSVAIPVIICNLLTLDLNIFTNNTNKTKEK